MPGAFQNINIPSILPPLGKLTFIFNVKVFNSMSSATSLSSTKQESSPFVFFRNLCTRQNSKSSERTGMSVNQVSDEVLYTGLIEMQELLEL